MKSRFFLFLFVVLVAGTSFLQKTSEESLHQQTVISVAAEKEEAQSGSVLSRTELVRQNGLIYPQTCCDFVGGICWVSVVLALIGGCFYAVSMKQN